MFFSVITKNSNWKILTKNLVSFKIWNIKDEKFEYYWGSLKNPILGGGVLKKPTYKGRIA